MPITPFHFGPGMAFKAILYGYFSLTIFGWSQIVTDLQPLYVLTTGDGELHGFSHTYIGATIIAIFCAITGKYLFKLVIRLIKPIQNLSISWPIAFFSAFLGTYSHVFMDSIIHADIEPFAPFSTSNSIYRIIHADTLRVWCVISGIIGGVFYVIFSVKKNKLS